MKPTQQDKDIIRASKINKIRQEIYYEVAISFAHEGQIQSHNELVVHVAHYLNMVEDKPIYRICLHEDTTVSVDCYDLIENFAPELNSYYSNADELPQWAQDKLAVLSLLDHTVVNKEVEGVGKRISEHIFWLYKEGNNHGDDARG